MRLQRYRETVVEMADPQYLRRGGKVIRHLS